MLRLDIITVFRRIFDSYLKESLLKRAQEKKIIDVCVHYLRDFTTDKHHKVDDRPFGGGPGMVLKIEPIYRAVVNVVGVVNVLNGRKKQLQQAKRSNKRSDRTTRTRIILFSTRGKKLDAKTAKRLAKYDRLVLICGRYEGVDERVAKYIADEEISIGDYVLNGGEVAAMALIEAVSRFVPGFLGKRDSLEEIKGSYPVYTRPAEFVPKKGGKMWLVPKVLLSGHHQKINAHRTKH